MSENVTITPSAIAVAFVFLLRLAILAFIIVLIVRVLRKYLKSSPVRDEKKEYKQSLGEALKFHRTSCHMTQEFVAESIGVTRQAVSKWENGTADPSTSNLLALAKLYGVSAEELISQVKSGNSAKQ
jgi:DNA-binding XRE family transcriptional regulator